MAPFHVTQGALFRFPYMCRFDGVLCWLGIDLLFLIVDVLVFISWLFRCIVFSSALPSRL